MSSTLNVWVFDGPADQDKKVSYADGIRLASLGQPQEKATDAMPTDGAGNIAFMRMPDGDYTLYSVIPNFEPWQTDIHLPLKEDRVNVELTRTGTDPQPPQPTGPLSKLHVEGYYLHNEQGRVFLNGASSFLAYKRFLDGDDIGSVFAELQSLGFNCIRLFGMVSSFSHWYPQDYGDRYYDSIPAFLDLCASYGLYVYWCAFADTRIVMPNQDDQQRHWSRTCDALRQRENALIEKGNELNQHDNAVDANVPKPDGLVSCSGSNGSNPDSMHPFPEPYWDICDLHVRRDYPKCVSDAVIVEVRYGYSGYPGAWRPVAHGETMPFGESAGAHGRFTDPEIAREFSASAGTACMKIHHNDAGVLSQLMGPIQKSCAQAWCSR